jgi:hypothetical protein
MLNAIIIVLSIACHLVSVYLVLNAFLLFGLCFLGLGTLGFLSVFEEELFR